MTTAFQQTTASQLVVEHAAGEQTDRPLHQMIEDLDKTISALELAERHVRNPGLAKLFGELAATRRLVLTESVRSAHINGVPLPATSSQGPLAGILLTAQTLLLGDEATLRYLIVTDLDALDRIAEALHDGVATTVRPVFSLAAECLRTSVARLERELI